MNWERIFNICMDTPIGKRYGTMSVKKQDNILDGFLDILCEKEHFCGEIDTAGNCRIIGKIVTLMRTMAYKASGKITPEGVCLSLISGEFKYSLTGNAEADCV